MCLIYEAMEAITTSLMTTSAVAYSAQLGTTTTLATIQGIIGGANYGVGMQNSKMPKILSGMLNQKSSVSKNL